MSKEITEEQAIEILKKDTKNITESDIVSLLENEKKIEQKVKNAGELKEYIDTSKVMFKLVRSYWLGEYKKVPWLTIAGITATLLYVFSPIDFIPDIIPVVGYVDDALVFSLCLKLIKQDLEDFEAWENYQDV